jgi:hypothetical protein
MDLAMLSGSETEAESDEDGSSYADPDSVIIPGTEEQALLGDLPTGGHCSFAADPEVLVSFRRSPCSVSSRRSSRRHRADSNSSDLPRPGGSSATADVGTEEAALMPPEPELSTQAELDALLNAPTPRRASDSASTPSDDDAQVWREQIAELEARMLRWFRGMEHSLRREHATRVAALLDGWPDAAALAAMGEGELRTEWERRFDQDCEMQRWHADAAISNRRGHCMRLRHRCRPPVMRARECVQRRGRSGCAR